ncbi:hypothetical protein FKM82_000874 [Ascaphus truei]
MPYLCLSLSPSHLSLLVISSSLAYVLVATQSLTVFSPLLVPSSLPFLVCPACTFCFPRSLYLSLIYLPLPILSPSSPLPLTVPPSDFSPLYLHT